MACMDHIFNKEGEKWSYEGLTVTYVRRFDYGFGRIMYNLKFDGKERCCSLRENKSCSLISDKKIATIARLGKYPDIKACVSLDIAECKGSFDITSSPSGANIYFRDSIESPDGPLQGVTPLIIDDLECGKYWIVFRLDGCEDGYMESATIFDGETTEVFNDMCACK